MRQLTLRILLSAFLAFPVIVSAADRGGVGIIKGTITIGGKPATDAVVSVEGLPAEHVKAQIATTKAQKKVMDQRNMKFTPTVVAILVGGTVDFPNNDSTWHNVYSKGGANDFDLGLYPPGKTRSAKFEKPAVARVLCNAHPNMEAFIIVKDHPFFSGTDSRGNYEIKNLPMGKARVEIWHPHLEAKSESVEIVRDGEVFVLNVDLKKR
jgi:plastocyanin